MAIDRNDTEVKALIEEVTAAATEALSAKNRELLGELKALKARTKGADIDPAEHAALDQGRGIDRRTGQGAEGLEI